MENNLYDTIKSLVDRKQEIKKIGGIIKHDRSRRSEYEKLADEFNQIEDKLFYIRDNCVISPMKLTELISKKEDKEYRLKIFREICKYRNQPYYTGDFVVCYLDSDNKYFDCDQDAFSLSFTNEEQYVNYSLSNKQFAELTSSLDNEKSYVLATLKDQDFRPILPPSCYIERINFTRHFIFGYADKFVSDKFMNNVEDVIKGYLEGINAEEFFDFP